MTNPDQDKKLLEDANDAVDAIHQLSVTLVSAGVDPMTVFTSYIALGILGVYQASGGSNEIVEKVVDAIVAKHRASPPKFTGEFFIPP